jgi:hypothetical protein
MGAMKAGALIRKIFWRLSAFETRCIQVVLGCFDPWKSSLWGMVT